MGWDQSELARRVGCTPAAINQIVMGHTRQSRFLPKIARELGLSLAYVAGETDDPESELPEETLTAAEREWVEQFRRIPSKDQEAALQLVRSIAGSAAAPTVHSPKAGYHAGPDERPGRARRGG